MDETAKILNYSDVFLSFFSDNATSCIHQTPDHSLSYIYSGELMIEAEGKKQFLRKNQCVFVRRDHRQTAYKKPYKGEQYKGISMVLKRPLLREVYAKLNHNDFPKNAQRFKNSVVWIENQPSIEGLFASITPYFDTNRQPSSEMISLKMQEAIMALLQADERFYPTLFDFAELWKIDLMAFMNENYMYDLSLAEIATYTGRSLATFKRDFKKVSDLSPEKWLVKKRLEVAYQRLQNHEKPSVVYAEVGFKSLSHFYQAFRKEYGFSLKEMSDKG